jgi:hypothetical protein
MFSSNGNDISNGINALLQRIQSNRSENSNSRSSNASQINQQVVDNLNVSSMMQLQNHIAAPIVSVVSSSMDFFGGPESIQNAVQAFDNDAVGIDRNVNSISTLQTSDRGMDNVTSAHMAVGTKRKKAESLSTNTNNITKVKSAEPSSGNALTKGSKKLKHTPKATEKVDTSVAFNDDVANASDMSFERAAVVAALTNLYGSGGKPDSTNRAIDDPRNGSIPLPVIQPTTNPAAIGGISGSSIETKKQSNVNKSPMKTLATHESTHRFLESMQNNSRKSTSTSMKKPLSSEKKNDQSTSSRKSNVVYQPSQYDVLLGRGKSNKNHPGNVWFQGT